MSYCTGYIADPPHIATARPKYKAVHAGAIPDAASIEEHTPDVLDQNTTGSCTGAATACAIYTALHAAGTPLSWVPSPKGAYGVGRAIVREPNADGTLPPLRDEGAQPYQVARGVTEYGVRPMGALVSGAYYDCDSSNVNEEPMLEELEEDALHLVVGQYAIASLSDICSAIVSGKPVTVAVPGGSDAWQCYTGGVIGPQGAPLDHYVTIVAYYTDASGRIILRIRNSWSRRYGINGDILVDQDAAQEFGDAIAWDIQMKEAA